MDFNVKEIGLVLLLLIATNGLTRYCAPEKVKYQTAEQQKQLDSLTVLSRNLQVSKEQLRDSLSETSEAFQDYIAKSKDEIASYSKITGRLRLRVDSLENVAASTNIADLINTDTASTNRYRDTTLTSRSTWGNGLLEAMAQGGIRNDSLFLDPPLIAQLRPLRLDVATTIADDHSRVNTLVTSPDLEDLKVESLTPLERKKRFPWTEIVAVASFVLGYAL